MAKSIATAVLDAPLDAIAAATEMYFCNGQPTSRADAITKKSANAITIDAGDFAKADGGVAGSRKLTVAAQSGTATASQNTDHIALCTGSALLLVTTAPAQTSNNGQPINSQAFDVTIGPLS
jgi:hypothetical protein